MSSDAGVPFPPLGNRFVVGLATAPLLTSADAARVLALAEGAGGLPPEGRAALDPLIAVALATANSEYFRFDLRFVDEVDPPAIVEIPSGGAALPGLDADHSTRKLTLFLPLGPGDGECGSIRFDALGKEGVLTVGTAVMFPAYLANVVEPTTTVTGVIAHVVGPAFR